MRRVFTSFIFSVLILATAMGQERTISGVVTASDTEQPLPGATVLIKGTATGTVTNVEGGYSIQAAPDDILTFSFVGYISQEIPVGDQTEINVTLEPDVGKLDEVVVVGYGVQKKSLITGSIAKVDEEEIEKSNSLRIEDAMQGKTAGVSITQVSGQPGAGFTVRVRGTGSNGNSEPIFIVDGLRMGGIENINVNDIESVEVLKDASSAAIYGAEGANGVVLITTKTGASQKPIFTYKFNYGIQEIANSEFGVMDSHDYLDYRWRALLNEGRDSAAINKMIPLPGDATYSTNWLEEVMSPAPMSEHFLSYSGGNETSRYNASGSYLTQDGIGGGGKANFTRLTARFSSDHKLKDWLTVGNKINYTRSERTSLPENSTFNSFMNMSILLDPLTPVTVPFDSLYYIGEDFRPLLVDDGEGNYYGVSRHVAGEIYNPKALLQTLHDENTNDKLFGTFYADIMPFEGLTFKTKLDFDLAYINFNGWDPKSYFNAEQINEFNGAYRGYSKYQTYQWGNFLNYDLNLGNHSIQALAGMEANTYQNINLSASGTNLIQESDNFAYVGTTPDSTHIAGDWADEVRRVSYIGRISYNYAEKYLLTTNFRTDLSTLFGPEYRAGYFPSLSTGWVISREDFFNVAPVSFLKLRASWGQNGSTSNLGSFGYLSLITSVYRYANADEQLERASEPRAISNPALRWEVSEQTDIGLDLGLLNNKLYFTADYYYKLTKDLITLSTFATLYGNYNSSINAGNILNQGVELELSWKDNFGNLNYNISL
ncbi:MAG: SusC/RagA family TonB-linked outer membrane protein, partial [bacterium]